MSIVGNKVIKEDEKLFKGFVLNPPFDPTTKVNRLFHNSRPVFEAMK